MAIVRKIEYGGLENCEPLARIKQKHLLQNDQRKWELESYIAKPFVHAFNLMSIAGTDFHKSEISQSFSSRLCI